MSMQLNINKFCFLFKHEKHPSLQGEMVASPVPIFFHGDGQNLVVEVNKVEGRWKIYSENPQVAKT